MGRQRQLMNVRDGKSALRQDAAIRGDLTSRGLAQVDLRSDSTPQRPLSQAVDASGLS
jgi:hypothetical protein